MCVQIQETTLKGSLHAKGVQTTGKTSSELNKQFLEVKKGEKLPGIPTSIDEIPADKIVVADMTNYANIHIVGTQADIEHLKRFQADYYIVDKAAIAGLYA